MNADKQHFRPAKAFRNFRKALSNLERALNLPEENEDYRNSAILSFVLAYEQCWKTLKWVLKEYIGIEEQGPKPVIQAAYQQGLLTEEDTLWIDMANDRNLVAHTYDEERAKEIYTHIKCYAKAMRAAHDTLLRLYPALGE